MGNKYNIEDSIEIVNLRKYAQEAVKNKDKEAALEAILLEYSKEMREFNDRSGNLKNFNNMADTVAKSNSRDIKSGKTDFTFETAKISELVKKNISEIQQQDKKEINPGFRTQSQKRNDELLRLAFGTSQLEKIENENHQDNIEKPKNTFKIEENGTTQEILKKTIMENIEKTINETINENKEEQVKEIDEKPVEENLENPIEKKEGLFSNVLIKAKNFVDDKLEEDIQEEQADIDQPIASNSEVNIQSASLNDETYEADGSEADEYDELFDLLLRKTNGFKVKTVFSFVIAVVLIVLSAVTHFNIQLPSVFMLNAFSLIPILTVSIFVLIILMNFSVIKAGAIDLFTKRESALSFMFLSILVLFSHSMFSFIGNVLRKEEFVSYASVAAFAFFTYNFGRLLWTLAHLKNFEEIYSASSCISEVRNVKEDEEYKKIANRFVNDDAKNFYYNVSVGTTGGFLIHALVGEKDIAFRKHAVLILISAVLALSIIFSFINGFNNLIPILVSIFAMLAPVNSELVGSIVFYKASKKARKNGAVVSGASVANEKQGVEAIMLRDRDIFRDGSVVIKGFRVVSSEHINHIISYVASIFVTIDSPAKIAFLDLIDNKESLLKEVYFFECFESEGIIAFIDGDKIMLGNYDFMLKNGIIPPEDSLKNFKTGPSRSNMYVAQNGLLVCVFSIGYLLDKEIEKSLNDMEKEDIKAAVATFDPNLNASLLCKRFSLDDASLSIMRSGDVMKFNENDENDDKIGRSGLYLVKRDAQSFIGLIKAIRSISFLSKTNHLILLASLIAAPVLWAVVVTLGGLLQITAFAVIIFHFLWCIPIFVNSLFT